MASEQTENKQEESLNLHDLLIDEKTDGLSDYLSLSIESLGEDTLKRFEEFLPDWFDDKESGLCGLQIK